jgi:hypothetical protein
VVGFTQGCSNPGLELANAVGVQRKHRSSSNRIRLPFNQNTVRALTKHRTVHLKLPLPVHPRLRCRSSETPLPFIRNYAAVHLKLRSRSSETTAAIHPKLPLPFIRNYAAIPSETPLPFKQKLRLGFNKTRKVETPTAFANCSPGLLQPWEGVGVSVSTLKEFANSFGVE